MLGLLVAVGPLFWRAPRLPQRAAGAIAAADWRPLAAPTAVALANKRQGAARLGIPIITTDPDFDDAALLLSVVTDSFLQLLSTTRQARPPSLH
jgi:hypothetical protein